MASNIIMQGIQAYGARQRYLGIERCNDWGGEAVAELAPETLVDIGCGDGSMLFRYLKKIPREFHGVEGAPALRAKAEARGLKVASFDLNGRWPYESNKFDVVFSSQVIEHLHNTRLFIEESFRVLKPGGTAIIMSENLCSLLNCLAMLMGYTPFSLMQVCGHYLGNPIGLHADEVIGGQDPIGEHVPIDHPAFSGVSGHVRVLTVRQANELFRNAGYEADVRSISILPIPDWLSRQLEKISRHRGHYMVIRARKPAGAGPQS